MRFGLIVTLKIERILHSFVGCFHFDCDYVAHNQIRKSLNKPYF